MPTTVSTADKDNLRLTGNQIKLSARSLENRSTASSRCALLTGRFSRCASTVPLLNFRYNEFESSKTSRRRPLSADFPFQKFANPYPTKMSSYSPDIASSEDDTDTNLPSSQLYQNLLSEPLHSWRDGERCSSSAKKSKKFSKQSCGSAKFSETSENLDTVSDASSLSEKDVPRLNLNSGSSPELVKSNSEIRNLNEDKTNDAICENLNIDRNKSMVLMPGLKTKPPLPIRKSDQINPPSTRTAVGADADEEHNFQDKLLSAETSDEGISTTTADSISDKVDLKYQNWMDEERAASSDILKSELNTDLSLHNLRLHNQVESHENSKRIIALPRKPALKKTPPDPEFNADDLKSMYEKHKSNFPSKKNFIKENIKMTCGKSKKSSGVLKNSYSKIKDPENHVQRVNQEVESWMSSKETSGKCTTTDNLEGKPTRQSSYLEFLNTIEEIEESCERCGMENLLEHDVDASILEKNDGNTYDDIAAILQVLEEEDKKSHSNMASMKEMINSELSSSSSKDTKENVVDFSLNLEDFISNLDANQSRNSSDRRLTENSTFQSAPSVKPTRDSTDTFRSSFNSSANLNDIITYLDEVDKNCAKTVACAKERVSCATQLLHGNVLTLDTIPKIEDLLTRTSEELSNYIIDLSLRLKEKSSAIALLQSELSGLRQQVTKINKDASDTIKQKLKTQKEDYENVVKRHQKFIDQLITDKKTLNQQCEALLNETKVLEDRYNSNLKAAEHRHKVEMIKLKEMHAAGEKIRKDRWVDAKTQKIKELTIKGLEPELDSMAARHQKELSDMRLFHKREIEDLELRNARKMQQHCEALREQLTTEREKAIAYERDVLKQRYDKMMELEEQNFQEQRRKLLAEHSNRILDCEDRENLAVQERDRAIKIAQADFEDKLQTALRRHNTELNALKEKTELEMDAFRNNYKKQAAMQLGEKEMQIREKCKRDRDKEIEAVIERLEMEAEETKSHIEQSTENRIKRLKEKYEVEIRDLEKLEKESSSKYAETKNRLLETEDVVLNLRATVKHLEFQLTDTKKVMDKLSHERRDLKEIVKEETQAEVSTLQKELQELRAEKENEMQKVYSRVKLAVARKDETLAELSRDNASLQEKCAYLENMLEQQRKEYLINNKQR